MVRLTLEFNFSVCYDEEMMNQNTIEPGILKNFRFFIGIRLALVINSLIYMVITSFSVINTNLAILIVFVVLDSTFLFIYLSIKGLVPKLKNLYLPLAILWATLGPMVQVYMGVLLTKTTVIQFSTYFMTPLPFLVMFIPLVIVAWQYSHRFVLYFCMLTFLVDCIFAIQAYAVSIESFLVIISIALIRTLLFLLVGNMISNLNTVQRVQRTRLIEANDRLAHYAVSLEQLTISRERNRMARELHDVMAHTMSGIAVELEGVRASMKGNPEQATKLLDHSLVAIREGLTETRRAIQDLRSSPLEDLGLGLSIQNLIDSLPNRADILVDAQIQNNIKGISPDIEHCFYRVAQEAINNISIHSKASKMTIQLVQENDKLKLTITDNGIGFNPESIDQHDKHGLLGMGERAEMINAHLTITSKTGCGTAIELVNGDGQ